MKKLVLLFAGVMLMTFSANAQVTLRANALGWGLGVFNAGFEFGLAKHFTLVAEGYYSPFWDTKSVKADGWMISPELRYYFCEKFNKHYIGLSYNYASYDKYQWNKKQDIRDGHASSIGLTYGHTWRFNHHWSFDLFGGVGCWFLKNDIYNKNTTANGVNPMLDQNKKETYFGVTRLGATFAYRF